MGRKWLAASLEHVNMARKGSQNKKKARRELFDYL